MHSRTSSAFHNCVISNSGLLTSGSTYLRLPRTVCLSSLLLIAQQFSFHSADTHTDSHTNRHTRKVTGTTDHTILLLAIDGVDNEEKMPKISYMHTAKGPRTRHISKPSNFGNQQCLQLHAGCKACE